MSLAGHNQKERNQMQPCHLWDAWLFWNPHSHYYQRTAKLKSTHSNFNQTCLVVQPKRLHLPLQALTLSGPQSKTVDLSWLEILSNMLGSAHMSSELPKPNVMNVHVLHIIIIIDLKHILFSYITVHDMITVLPFRERTPWRLDPSRQTRHSTPQQWLELAHRAPLFLASIRDSHKHRSFPRFSPREFVVVLFCIRENTQEKQSTCGQIAK